MWMHLLIKLKQVLLFFNQLPTFTTANKLLSDKFRIDLTKFNNNKNRIIELSIGDKICIVKPSSNLVCDTIVKGILPKRHNGLESPIVYVLVTDNKFDFYIITEIADKKYRIIDRALKNIIVRRLFIIHQLAHF
jgi:CRISPR/Cas system-associated protein endoribonuclease Cas2